MSRLRSLRGSVEEQDERVKKFLEDNKDVNFVDKIVFDDCYYIIKTWLNVQVLVPYLMRFHMLTSNDEHYLTTPYTSEVEKSFHLVRVAERAGRNGYMLLYMSILDSIHETRGHADVISELDKAAKRRLEMEEKLLTDVAITYPKEVNPCVQGEINRLQEQFASVASSLLLELEDKEFDVKAVRCKIMVLPEHINKEIFLSLSVQELSKHCDSIHILFHFLNANVWNFLDYHLLKYVVDIFGTEEIKLRMLSYIQQLEQFQELTSVHDFVMCWAGHCVKPSNQYAELEVRFEPDQLQNFTLQQLNHFRKQIESKFLPPLTEYAMIHYRLRFGSFIVTWILPGELAKKLEQGVSVLQSYELFESYFVDYFSVNNKTVYSSKDYTALSTAMLNRLKQDYYSLQSQNEVFHRQESSISASMLSVFDDNYLSSHTPVPPMKVQHSDSSISSNEKDEDDEDQTTLPYFDEGHRDSSISSVKKGDEEEELTDLEHLESSIRSPQFCDSSIHISFNARQERTKYDSGRFPSIAVNNGGIVVEVCHQMATYWMLYRIGKLQEGRIIWSGRHPRTKPSMTYYGSGSYPQISINDKNIIIEVHGGEFKEKCYYRVGHMTPEKGKIKFFPSKSFEKLVGHYPSVAINNNNYVIAVYQKDILTKTICYRIGIVSEMEEGAIVWVETEHSLKWKAENVSVDINNDNMIVLAFQTRNYHVHYIVGMLDFVKGEIMWSDPVHLHAGVCLPSISLNDNKHVILVCKNAMNFSLLCDVGFIVWERNIGMISWSIRKSKKSVRRYGKGRYPSVCMNGLGQVVEAHEVALPHTGNLHYYTGQIVVQS